MKRLFLIILSCIGVAAIATHLLEPEVQSEVPVLYLSASPSVSRVQQMDIFHRWLVEKGHTTPQGKPCMDLRLELDAGSSTKRLIQGVSGVASDILTGTLPYFNKAGFLEDITSIGPGIGIGPDASYPGMASDFVEDGRQIGFFTGVYVVTLWANIRTFQRYGMEPPPRYWDIDTFERIGREFVRRANPPGQRQQVFFANSLGNIMGKRFIRSMQRDMGHCDFNETMTRCTMDDPRYATALARVYRWSREEGLLPTAADDASMDFSQSGASFSDTMLQLFHDGRYAMITAGRHYLIRMREFTNPPVVSVSYFPNDSFTNTVFISFTASIYRRSAHKDLATLYLKFLASPEYNRHVIELPDGLPPIPEYTREEAFLRPPRYRNEWAIHEAQAHAAMTIAIGRPQCPFMPIDPTDVIKQRTLEKVLNGLASPREAAAQAGRLVNDEIARKVADSDRLRRKYEHLLEIQERIEANRAQGRQVPLSWITNPFHRRYYLHRGWAYDDSSEPQSSSDSEADD